MSRKVIGASLIALITGLLAGCGSDLSSELEVQKSVVRYAGFHYPTKIISITNKSETEIAIKAITFPKQNCTLLADAIFRDPASYTLTYGKTTEFPYNCSTGVNLLHAVVQTSKGDIEYTWEE